MKNYQRYKNVTNNSYEKKSIMNLIYKNGNNTINYFLKENIKNSDVLELGVGTGKYTKILLENNNRITGVDINSHLFKLSNVEFYSCNCLEIDKYIPLEKKYDYIVSFWMTEYLSKSELDILFSKLKNFLREDGMIIITIISKGFWGWFYRIGAALKGIKKYNYSYSDINNTIINCNLIIEKIEKIKFLGIEFAYIYHFKIIK